MHQNLRQTSSTIAYLPFNFFCWLTPIVSMLYGWFNITIHPIEDETDEADLETERVEA